MGKGSSSVEYIAANGHSRKKVGREGKGCTHGDHQNPKKKIEESIQKKMGKLRGTTSRKKKKKPVQPPKKC